jgi:hypothetical protein
MPTVPNPRAQARYARGAQDPTEALSALEVAKILAPTIMLTRVAASLKGPSARTKPASR